MTKTHGGTAESQILRSIYLGTLQEQLSTLLTSAQSASELNFTMNQVLMTATLAYCHTSASGVLTIALLPADMFPAAVPAKNKMKNLKKKAKRKNRLRPSEF